MSLDSVAAWGKFPKFCVDVYRWGDKFFNSYDSAYVEGTGYKFNGKFKTETWTDRYNFILPNDYRIAMSSDWCTSSGLWLTYLAVSVGYDVNVSKFIGNRPAARKRFNFSFNCALFSADLYWISNDVGTTITSYGEKGDIQHNKLNFTGINTELFGVDAYYYINNKKYSHAAAFNYSKIQKRSQGSFFFGFSYWKQDFKFDFSDMPMSMLNKLPDNWAENEYKYEVDNHNYSVVTGYGYNWVFRPHWLLGVSESPVFGIKHGYINNPGEVHNTFSLTNRLQASLVWNNNKWFAGLIGTAENGLIYDKSHALFSGIYNFEVSVGYRFNLW